MPWTFFGGYKIIINTPYITIYKNTIKSITNSSKYSGIYQNLLKTI
jgi:hypothetical protein